MLDGLTGVHSHGLYVAFGLRGGLRVAVAHDRDAATTGDHLAFSRSCARLWASGLLPVRQGAVSDDSVRGVRPADVEEARHLRVRGLGCEDSGEIVGIHIRF